MAVPLFRLTPGKRNYILEIHLQPHVQLISTPTGWCTRIIHIVDWIAHPLAEDITTPPVIGHWLGTLYQR